MMVRRYCDEKPGGRAPVRPRALRFLGFGVLSPVVALVALCSYGLGCAHLASEGPTESPSELPADGGERASPGPEGEGGTADRADASGEAPAEEEPWGPQPPDGQWLEEDDGRRYFLSEVPRIEGAYDWVNDERTRIRVQYGMEFDVAEYDDETFVLKIYEAPRPQFANAQERVAARGEAGSPRQPPEPRESIAPETTARLRLASASKGLPRAGQWRHGFELADMNGDGYLDLVHGPPRKGDGRPVIYLGGKDGTWKRWAEVRFPREVYDYGDVAVADFNRDGIPDLALAMHMRGVRVLVGDGAGSFSPWSEGIRYDGGRAGDESAFSSRALAAVDWNADGWTDLVALGEGFRGARFQPPPGEEGRPQGPWGSAMGLRLFLNQGDGTWREAGSEGRDRSLGDALAVGDFDGDGAPDVVTASMTRGWRGIVYLGDGEEGWEHQALPELRPRALVHATAAADLDGDGLDEVILAYTQVEAGVWRTGIDVFDPAANASGDSGLTWERRPLLEIENDRFVVTALGAGDLDGDGTPDVVALTQQGQLRLFLGTGGLRYVEDEGGADLRPPHEGCQGQAVVVRDLNGDGAPSLIASFAGEATGMPGVRDAEGCGQGGSLDAWVLGSLSSSVQPGS